MIRTIRERLKAKETRFGTLIKNWVGKVFLLVSAIGAGLEYLAVVPQDWIPGWLRITVVVAGLTAFVYGRLTVKKDVDVALVQKDGQDKVIVTKKP